MKTVNIAMLRAKLSRYLAMVRRGETIEVLDRRTPIARLVPVEPMSPGGKDRVPAWLRRLAEEGVVTIGSLKPYDEILRNPLSGTGGHTGAVEALIEERRTGGR